MAEAEAQIADAKADRIAGVKVVVAKAAVTDAQTEDVTVAAHQAKAADTQVVAAKVAAIQAKAADMQVAAAKAAAIQAKAADMQVAAVKAAAIQAKTADMQVVPHLLRNADIHAEVKAAATKDNSMKEAVTSKLNKF